MCACKYFWKDKYAEEQSSDEGKHLINLISIITPVSGWATRLRYRNPFFVIPHRDDAAVYLGKAVPLRSTTQFFSPHNLINQTENNLVPTVFC